MKALIIEDDPEIVESVSLAFQILWPDVQVSSTHLGKKALELVESEAYNFALLDLGLIDINGFEVLKQIRCFSSIPIIILTVKADEADIITRLEWGADDYLVKPFGYLELMVRVRAIINVRRRLAEIPPLSFDQIEFDPSILMLKYGTHYTSLNTIEAIIINHLMRNMGQPATYVSLVEEVWGTYFPRSVKSLHVYIKSLRAKMGALIWRLTLKKNELEEWYLLDYTSNKDVVPL
jgi:two-component system KDP operon response regulator KdpE